MIGGLIEALHPCKKWPHHSPLERDERRGASSQAGANQTDKEGPILPGKPRRLQRGMTFALAAEHAPVIQLTVRTQYRVNDVPCVMELTCLAGKIGTVLMVQEICEAHASFDKCGKKTRCRMRTAR